MIPADIHKVLKDAGIHPGDTLMIHGDSIVAAQLRYLHGIDAQMKEFFNQVINYLGKEGTLIVPTFTYSFTNNESFDVDNSESKVGLFSEHFRKMDGAVRSRNPLFSVAAIGKNQNYMKELSVTESFGENSIFDYLYEVNAKIMNLACDFLITFTHYVEQDVGVSYRSFKTFKGTIVSKEKNEAIETLYYVRDLGRKSEANLSILKKYLIEKNMLKIVPFGRFASYSVNSRNFYDAARYLLSIDETSLIEEGARE